ncbi:MAG: DNA phosphorothioation system sulfurtransferase DndC [Candidatus Thiothrix sulfatifontis]|nr:MAG: DNA phosphorothioation system sulfurtransferase DndC [Candidatus Thiothrix sulfatifontis]
MTQTKPKSIPTTLDEKYSSTLSYLEKLYLDDERPWVVAFSGGKDSTLVLQLVYETVNSLQAKGCAALKPVYVLSSDTRVESPNVAKYVRDTLNAIDANAQAGGLPFHVQLVEPTAAESFWGKMIGRGYPPPTRHFRWCTSYMKIKPSRRAIESIAHVHGSVILLLGTRLDESSDRKKRMLAISENESQLNPHHEIPNALVAKPVANWTTDEVWEYLYTFNPPPWGKSHDEMLALYRQANSNECPVVLDLSTPSCGGSRFGCWTCTVVKEDKSMQGFLLHETRLEPLYQFRNWLKEMRENESYRSPVRRNNQVGLGPFKPDARKMLLKKLLETERKTGFELISDAELAYIQQQWISDFDYSNQSVSELVKPFGREVPALESLMPVAVSIEKDIIEKLAIENDLPSELLESLLQLGREAEGDMGRWGAKAELERKVGEFITKATTQINQAIPQVMESNS